MSALPSEPTAGDLEKHTRFLRGLACDLLRDEHLAEDVVQETFVAALTHDGPRPDRPRAWLAGVLRNRFRMAVRGERRREERERMPRPDRAVQPPDAVASTLEVQRQTLEAVGGLPESYRSVVVQRYYHDLLPKEIARRGGIPVETVKTRLRRALARLRDRLDRDHAGDRRVWGLALAPLVTSTPATPAAGLVLGGALVKAKSGVLLVLFPLLGLLVGVVGTRLLAPAKTAETADPGRLEERIRELRGERDELLEERDHLRSSLSTSERERASLLAHVTSREEGPTPPVTQEEPAAVPKTVAETDWSRLSRAIVAWSRAEEAGVSPMSDPELAIEVSLLMRRLRAMAEELGVPEMGDVFSHPAAFPHLVKGVLEVILPEATVEARGSVGAEIADIRSGLDRGKTSPLMPLEKRALDLALAWETAKRFRGRLSDEELAGLLRVLGAGRPGTYRIGWYRSARAGLERSVRDTFRERFGLEAGDGLIADGIADSFVTGHLLISADLTRRLGADSIEKAFTEMSEEERKPPTISERLVALEVRARLLTHQAEAERSLYLRLSADAQKRMLAVSPQILLLGESE